MRCLYSSLGGLLETFSACTFIWAEIRWLQDATWWYLPFGIPSALLTMWWCPGAWASRKASKGKKWIPLFTPPWLGTSISRAGGSRHPCEAMAIVEYRLFHVNYPGITPREKKKINPDCICGLQKFLTIGKLKNSTISFRTTRKLWKISQKVICCDFFPHLITWLL